MINAPSGLIATAVSSFQINLIWRDNDPIKEDGFEIERSMNGVTYTLLSTLNANTTTYSDTGPFLPFVTYYYRVRAMNTIGDRSGYSNVASAITVRPEWRSIAAGESHSLVLAADGTIWGWGDNQYGQLDPSNNASSFTLPTLLNPDTDWLRITAGYNHTLAIKTNNTLWAWGLNENGQLGLGNTDYPDSPTPVGTDSDWSLVAGGTYHTIALKTGGTLWAWGLNEDGQLGLNWGVISRTTPTQIDTASDWSSIASGGRHTIALKTNRTLWAWGWGYYCQLGDGRGAYSSSCATPCPIGNDSDWSKISAGYIHTIALKTGGTLWQWGTNYYISAPTKVGMDTDWTQITAGGTMDEYLSYHSLALKTTGSLWAWGWNAYGQLGLGDNSLRANPTQIGTDANWAAVVAGGWHSIARTNDGTLWVWGRNNLYQLGIENTVNQIVPINLNFPQPSYLIATVITGSQIALSWLDNSSNKTGFKIERSPITNTNYTEIATVAANITSYLDTRLTPLTTYYYHVCAFNAAFGDSPYSNEIYAIPATAVLTFDYTGSVQTWVVPADVTLIQVDVKGAQGGSGGGVGGLGARVQTTLSVTPGNTLYIYVGGAGGSYGGYNGGGNGGVGGGGPRGGGASDIRTTSGGLGTRIVVAGGGGGSGQYSGGGAGGNGGYPNGGDGAIGVGFSGVGCGGTQTAGGAGGAGISGQGVDGTAGSSGQGGNGGTNTGGGGGGGYYGGGGSGGGMSASGGGGGSSWTSGTSPTYQNGVQTGNGQIIITY
jgi:alpha-tubulin suppressor-like RCC1 family protein